MAMIARSTGERERMRDEVLCSSSAGERIMTVVELCRPSRWLFRARRQYATFKVPLPVSGCITPAIRLQFGGASGNGTAACERDRHERGHYPEEIGLRQNARGHPGGALHADEQKRRRGAH